MQIAICDDEKSIGLILEEKIKKLLPDAVIDKYLSGDELIASGCEPDILFLDIQMPGMSGIELAETIVRRGYPCKIVFLTGYDDFSYIHSAFQVNAVDYLLKPFTIEEVEACLKKVRSELEKSEIADWSRKTAAKQLLEMALREKQLSLIHI